MLNSEAQASEETPSKLQRYMETGLVMVEKVGNKSTVTRCFSKYPLKFIIPTKVGPSKTDAVWIYSLTYGGGIVSGDKIGCQFVIGDGCTTVLTTQASTKVYRSIESNCSDQVLEAKIGKGALFVIIPDPVTCFSTARYTQKQTFSLTRDSNLLIVDWITSGRHENGEKWQFNHYKSTNNIFLDDDQPLFLDTILLEQGGVTSVTERMQDYQVLAMVILLGPKLIQVQKQFQNDVKKLMSEKFQPSSAISGRYKRAKTDNCSIGPTFLASCSAFGPQGIGLVVRVASTTTESVYVFLRHQLASLEGLLGVRPYC